MQRADAGSILKKAFALVAGASILVAACSSAEGPTDTTTDLVESTTLPSLATTSTAPTTTAQAPAYRQVRVLGDGDGIQFISPNHLALDRDGNLYVTEFSGGRVFVFSPEGDFLFQFAGPGTEAGQLSQPTGIAVDAAGNIYVGESGTSRVQKFDPEGVSIAMWGQFGVDPGEFGSAMGIGINEALGRVYVADHVNSRIHVFTMDGELLFMFPRNGDFTHIGNEPDQMWLPIGVDVAADGTVYVVDSGNSRVQKFTPDGEIIEVLSPLPVNAPQVISVEADGSFWLAGPNDQEIAYFTASGDLIALLVPPEGGFASPHGTETGIDGTIWVADTGNGVVRGYQLTDAPLAVAEPSPTTTIPADVEIAMLNFDFAPEALTVSVGDTVRWTNPSDLQHTATSTGFFDSGPVGSGDTFTYSFNSPGTFEYFCSIHGAAIQSGVIIVEPSDP
jgi:DNA-binding beta-propeller fold protein YncE